MQKYCFVHYNNCYMKVEIDELVIGDDQASCGDTFIFEPAKAEEHLGRLLIAVEAGDTGACRELIETVVQALQREYYRDANRGMLASFESALHQVNLVLHDLTEMAISVLNQSKLHVSCAGDAVILLGRQGRLTSISAGLSHSPVTDPLRTFAQVASGVVKSRDVLFIGTSQMENIWHYDDLARLSIDGDAQSVSKRLRQLYEDQRKSQSVAALIISLEPHHEEHHTYDIEAKRRSPIDTLANLSPRRPLLISQSLLKRLILLGGRLLRSGWKNLRQVVWPMVKEGSKRSGTALYRVSRSAGQNVKTLSKRRPPTIRLRSGIRALPRSSKLFAGVALILAASLIISLVLLQQKRTADLEFQRGSELLHEARTKKEAAETALIYDNRDQARSLLRDAEGLVEQINALGLYADQTAQLAADIVGVQDGLDKVVRVTPADSREVGDFGSVVGRGILSQLFYLQDALYSFKQSDNSIVKMDRAGQTTLVSQTTSGIGFFSAGTAHEADKALVLITDSPGVAVYDTKTNVLQKQEMSFQSSNPEVVSVATFGNRMYILDRAANNIFGYSKTLRGYSGGTGWITADDFPRDTIRSIGIDGYIYTLHDDGTINKLLKGAPVDFTLEQIEPPLTGSAKLYINEDLRYLYVFDPPHQRVVVYDTVGNLNRQIYLDELEALRDIAVDSAETTLYVLDGTKVLAVSLTE